MLSAEGKTLGLTLIGFIAEQSKIASWGTWTPGDLVDTSTGDGKLLAEVVRGVTLLLLGKLDFVPFVHATQGIMHICRIPAHDKVFVVTSAEGALAAGLTNMLYAVVDSSLNALARGQISPDEVRALPYRPEGIRGVIDERSDWYSAGQNRYVVVLYDWRQSTIASRLHLYERTAGVYLEVTMTDEERTQLAKLIELKRLSARAAGA